MTTVMLDTNILVSAILNRDGVPRKAYIKAVEAPYKAIICDNILEELQIVFNRKFPDKIRLLESFIAEAIPKLEIVPVPPLAYDDEEKIRDVKDRPILRAALNSGADILVSGDKDFLESGVNPPKIMKAAEFMLL